MPWSEFLTKRPTEAVEFRVRLSPIDYYNFGFADDAKWQSYRLDSPDGEHSIYGYTERGSVLDARLRPPPDTKSMPVLLSLRFPEGAESSKPGHHRGHDHRWLGPGNRSITMTPTTYDKALELNLDPQVYGTFAEIGAGQETGNWFFRASGTAGLVAKTISAYDMTMSDAIYGRAERYVSADRLAAMLDHEYSILLERLGPKTRQGHDVFLVLQHRPRPRIQGLRGVPRLARHPFPDETGRPAVRHHPACPAARQPDDRPDGGARRHRREPDPLGLPPPRPPAGASSNRCWTISTPGRVEVDLLKFTGHGYGFFDNRFCALQLVESGLTDATMFLPSGEVVQPAEALYHRPVLLLRGSFDPVIKLHLAMLEQARAGLLPIARGEGPWHGDRALRNLDAQPAARPGHRSGGFHRSLGCAAVTGKNRAGFELRGVSPDRRVSQSLHQQAGRHRAEHRTAQRVVQSQVVGESRRRAAGIIRAAFQGGGDACRSSRGKTARPANW